MLKNINTEIVENISREQIWSELNLSGSKFKEWCLTPEEFVKNKPKVFSDFVKEKMDFGNKIEDFIFDQIRLQRQDLGFYKDKKTYQHNKYKFCYGNFDGFFKDGFLEIKNTEKDNITSLFNFYQYQLMYYSWFSGYKKVMFVTLAKGYKLRKVEFEFSQDHWDFVEKKIKQFENYLKTGLIPEPEEFENVIKEDIKEIDLSEYDKNYSQYLDLKKQFEKLDEKIKNYFNQNENISKLESENFTFSISEKNYSRVNKKKLNEFLNKYDKSENDFIEKSVIKVLSKKEK